jgi:mono/diheme cytochrome c family protein
MPMDRLPTVAVAAFAVMVSTSVDAENAQAEFAKSAQPFFTEHCDRCHNEKKQKGDFRMDSLSREFNSGKDAGRWADVMDKIASGEMPPEDEKQPKSEDRARIVEWIAGKLKEGEAARLAKRERVSFHKLTRDEYVHTIKDLLGVTYDAADPTGLSEDDAWNGFERIGSVLSLSPSHVEKHFAAAETILAEAFPEKPAVKFIKHKDALDLRSPTDLRAELEAQEPGLSKKVRVEVWPGHEIQGGRPGPGQALPASGDYRVRIQLSGLKPKNGRAPHLAVYATELDRMLFEQDVIAPEDKPVVLEFTAHLPAGGVNLSVMNSTPGPSVLPRSGRADPRIPFFSIKDGRRPWQIKLTDEEGLPLYPFLILDWIEWEGPLGAEGPTYAQREYMPQESGNMTQVRAALTKFCERAYRRPVRDDEVDALVTLLEKEMKSGEKFEAAMKTAMLAVLCAKDFLYLVEGNANTDNEADKTVRLTSFELASRLSYFLWSTMPDAELLSLARSGKLQDKSVLRAQVQRMLRDPKAARFSEAFPREWLQLRMVGMFPPDKKLYPDYDTYLEKSMKAETTAFFREVLEKNLSLREFLDSDWTMVNARLASHYGMPGIDVDRFERVALKPEDQRGGLLTQASILSLTSDGTRHRPVHRGKWVLESIVGKPPPPPPANVPAIEPTPATQPKATLRMKLEAHKNHDACASCHAKIDPLGLAFDNYDAIGRWRTEEVVGDGVGANPKVDSSGKLPDGREFRDAAELKRLLLADIDKFNATVIEKMATFALRRVMTLDDRGALSALAKQSKAADYRLHAIVENLALSELFQNR